MNHPPIPPNCDLFEFDCGEWWFRWPVGTMTCLNTTCKDLNDRTQIIASVARCAWLDERVRLYADYRTQCSKCYGYEDEKWPKEHPDLKAKACIDNAEAWRMWGGVSNENP